MTDSSLVHEYRLRAVAEIEAVCPAEIGTAKARAVCQGREHWHHYSGCADLYHYVLERLRLKNAHINRDDPATKDINEWVCGVNVGRLVYWPGVAVASFGPVRPKNNPPFRDLDIRGLDVDGGDCLIRWSKPDTTDAHVVCVMARHADGTLSTAEFGQARPIVGRLFQRTIVPGPRERPWKVWLPLPMILAACGVGDAA